MNHLVIFFVAVLLLLSTVMLAVTAEHLDLLCVSEPSLTELGNLKQ